MHKINVKSKIKFFLVDFAKYFVTAATIATDNSKAVNAQMIAPETAPAENMAENVTLTCAKAVVLTSAGSMVI